MIKIEVEKVIVRGEKKRKVLKIQALKEKDLPVQYLRSPSAVYFKDGWINIVGLHGGYTGLLAEHAGKPYRLLEVGKVYSDECFSDTLRLIQDAGQLLKRINAELALENEGWSGKVEYHI